LPGFSSLSVRPCRLESCPSVGCLATGLRLIPLQCRVDDSAVLAQTERP
jgi:hypothetical protein